MDATTGRVKASTDAGQVLVLAMAREALQSMKIGDTFTLVVPQHAKMAEQR
jgi:FKBP-type peptidyl-prolyl cis-trans isomerase